MIRFVKHDTNCTGANCTGANCTGANCTGEGNGCAEEGLDLGRRRGSNRTPPLWVGLTFVWAVTCTLSSAACLAAQKPDEAEPGPIVGAEFQLALDDNQADQVDAWIVQLSSPDYAERQAARANLTSMGAPAFAKLREAYFASDELEVRLLIERLVHDAYIRWHARVSSAGFLGITSQRLPITNSDDKRIAPGFVGLVVASVMADTPAHRAGLAIGDVVVSLNGNRLLAQDDQPFNRFASEIQRLGPGRRVRLAILRGGRKLEVTPVLTAPSNAQVRSVVNLDVRVQEAMERFPQWWVTQFQRKGTQ